MTTSTFTIGQTVTYRVCNSTYTGGIVKINGDNLVIIDCAAGMELFKAGCAVGSQVSIEQVIN